MYKTDQILITSRAHTRSASSAASKDEHVNISSCGSMVFTVQTDYIA